MLHSRLKFEQKCTIFKTALFVEMAEINIFYLTLNFFFLSSFRSYEVKILFQITLAMATYTHLFVAQFFNLYPTVPL